MIPSTCSPCFILPFAIYKRKDVYIMALTTAATKCGVLRGIPGRRPSTTVFKGVPYAKPPVGDLRFAPPQPPAPWEGELLCDRYSPSAIQRKPFADPDVREISEDCLYLNIWTPAESSDERLPVLFWVHGGGFVTGCGTSPEFDGEAFNKRGVILVTFNYRLGALGYLALPELFEKHGTAGNNGLLDQIAALRWVQANIAAFGGDPDNITVFGFSAGGMSTRMLMCSPLSRDIMKRVIVESGSGITDSDYYRPLKEKLDICVRGMKRLGWTMEDLMTRDASEVFDRLQDATIGELEFWEKSVFQPNTDGFSLLETPGVSIWKGDCADIPVIAGSASGDNGWIKIIRHEVPDEAMIPAFVYSRGVAWAQRNADTGRRPIYTYHFERTQPQKRWASETNRTPHGSEIVYVMGTLNHDDFGDYDYELSDLLCSYWSNFAKTGDPNGDGLPEWTPYAADHRVSLHITDDGCRVEQLMKTEAAERAIRFVAEHPGVIRSLDGI